MPNLRGSLVRSLTYSTSIEGRWRRLLIRGIEFGTGSGRINRLYAEREQWLRIYPDLWTAALAMLNVQVTVTNQPNLTLRDDRPLVLLANHPFGILDGIILCQLAARLRPDFRILINAAFQQVDSIRQNSLPIDFRETRDALATNLASRKAALEVLRRGGAIAVFPSGGVATRHGWRGEVQEEEWKSFTAKLIRTSKADVLPVYFHGENSRLFHLVSQFSQTLRLSLLIHEMKRKIGSEIRLTIGDPIHYEQLEPITCKDELIKHLRRRTYELGGSAVTRWN